MGALLLGYNEQKIVFRKLTKNPMLELDFRV